MHEFNVSPPFANCGGKIHPLLLWCPSLHFGRNLEELSSCFVFFTSVPHYSYMSSVCPAPHGHVPVSESGASVSHVRPCLRWWGFRRFQRSVCSAVHNGKSLSRSAYWHTFAFLTRYTLVLLCFPAMLGRHSSSQLESRRVVVASGPSHCAALIRCRFSRV